MAWIAKDKEGDIYIYELKPSRGYSRWEPKENKYGKIDMIKLPSDADEKLIGKHIDWTDEPVKIN